MVFLYYHRRLINSLIYRLFVTLSSNLSPVYISNIENNKKKPSLESLIKISNVLGITVDELLTGNLLSHPSDYQTDINELISSTSSSEEPNIYLPLLLFFFNTLINIALKVLLSISYLP